MREEEERRRLQSDLEKEEMAKKMEQMEAESKAKLAQLEEEAKKAGEGIVLCLLSLGIAVTTVNA